MDKACTFDLTDQKSVVQHVRDLLNLAPLLERGLDDELGDFIIRLKEVGWGDKQVADILTYAGQGNRFEHMEDYEGHRLLPRPLPERGDQAEWRLLKPRAKK
jgi:hypothetical protein